MNLALVLLAAGLSRRYGKSKILDKIDGSTMLARAMKALPAKTFARSVVVGASDAVLDFAAAQGYLPVRNPDPARGISSSIILGLEALGLQQNPFAAQLVPPSAAQLVPPSAPQGDCPCAEDGNCIKPPPNSGVAPFDFDGVLFAVCDQPWLTHESAERLISVFSANPNSIVALGWQGIRGNPVIFPQDLLPALLALRGDTGGSAVIARHPQRLILVEALREKELLDVDTPQEGQ